MNWIGKELRFYREVLEGRPYFNLSFEALYLQDRAQQGALLARLCDFLSADISDFYADNIENYIYRKARRQTTDKVLESVPNYRAFRKYL